ncbi:hypothetical protein [Lysinibacillus telephonicus]|uniref:hypothetical protein n=1 Tax=Lysinibacillus telephonicus TaxID=1714840 RepID=UPI0037CEF9DC
MIKNQNIFLGVIIFIIFLVVVPLLINSLMFEQKLIDVNGDETIWVPALATYFGALFGGLVSGLLTLFGVKISLKGSFEGINLTLEYQEKERIKETTGQKLNRLYKVKKIIYHLDRLLSRRKDSLGDNWEKVDSEEIDTEIRKYITPEFNNLLELSASVDWEFYDEIKKFVKQTRPLIYAFDSTSLDKLTDIVDNLTTTIEVKHEERLAEQFKKASN